MSTSGGPNQSKSFRVLQHITDTAERLSTASPSSSAALVSSEPAELHEPHYARALGPADGNQYKSSNYGKPITSE